MAQAGNGGVRKAWTTVVWPMFRPHKWLLILAVGLNALHGIAVSTQLLAPKWLIDDIIEPKDLTSEQRWMRFVWLGLGYLAMTVVGRMLVWHVSFRMLTWIREQAVLALRARFFRHVNHLCLRWHGQHSSGELFSYLFGSPLGTNAVNFSLPSFPPCSSTRPRRPCIRG
jgi:ATP-binding cassette subfamily B protein/subfamily B ATP-binding cassette protein MsbA